MAVATATTFGSSSKNNLQTLFFVTGMVLVPSI